MHEITLTRNVVDMVVEEAVAAKAAEVRAVYLDIGVARDIVVGMFEEMFTHMARGTVAEKAELVITRIPFMVRCHTCGRIYHIDSHDSSTWACGVCEKRDYELYSGMEFTIRSFELIGVDSYTLSLKN